LSQITVIGAGNVGSTIAYTLMLSNLVSRMVLVDIDQDKAEGEAMDLAHGVFFTKPVEITAGDYSMTAGSQLVIIAAGANQKPGETRLDLITKNLVILKEILTQVRNYCPDSIYLIVTNPVDILTWKAADLLDLPIGKVIGSGTVLDSSRFRYLIGQNCGVDPRNVHAYVMGEHGDSEVLAWSIVEIAGIPLDVFCKTCGKNCGEEWRKQVDAKVRNAAYEVINRKGATYYAISLATRRIVEAVLRNENSMLTVSVPLRHAFGQEEICFSMPWIVNENGATRNFKPDVAPEEEAALFRSAELLKQVRETAMYSLSPV